MASEAAATDTLTGACPFDYSNPSSSHVAGRDESHSLEGFDPCPAMCRNPCGPPFVEVNAEGKTIIVMAVMNGWIA